MQVEGIYSLADRTLLRAGELAAAVEAAADRAVALAAAVALLERQLGETARCAWRGADGQLPGSWRRRGTPAAGSLARNGS
jgi:hypothetical protein